MCRLKIELQDLLGINRNKTSLVLFNPDEDAVLRDNQRVAAIPCKICCEVGVQR